MTRFRLLIFALIAVLIIVVVTTKVRNTPTLRILVHGVPAANTVVTDFQTMSPKTTDANGRLDYELESGKVNAVLVPSPTGGVRQVSFPAYGHKTVDLRGRYLTSKTTFFRFGVFRLDEYSEQYDLTDEEVELLETGEKTRDEVHTIIRRECAKQNDPPELPIGSELDG